MYSYYTSMVLGKSQFGKNDFEVAYLFGTHG